VAERTGCAQALARPGQVRLDGLLGEALEANRRGRLSTFITGPDSPAIAIFDPAHREHNEEGDWYGEHAGKWLAAAAKAAARSDDADLRGRVLAVADHLLQVQAADGYLGTYAPARRFMVPQPPRPESWNGEPDCGTAWNSRASSASTPAASVSGTLPTAWSASERSEPRRTVGSAMIWKVTLARCAGPSWAVLAGAQS